ncbi:MAG: hypothetical protein KC877_04620 [Candidatus Kaiserbacteria bacterium]|nr:hypothetical protein [Candidatus Kaiserbacteria bacterium]MCB9816695.1 hypothetical protein [Candidatus Nomurabacteria bacterium]
MLRLLASLLEGIIVWLLRPRIILLIIVFLIIGGVAWMLYDVPTIGVALKKFVLKTLPKWWQAGVKLAVKFAPKAAVAISNAAKKKSVRLLAVYLGLHFLAKEYKLRFRHRKRHVFARAKYHLIERPVLWWKSLTLTGKILVAAGIGAIIISIPSLHFLGLLLIPLAILKQMLVGAFRFVVPRIGAGALVDRIERGFANVRNRFTAPEERVKRKWKNLRAMLLRQRKIHAKAAELKLNTAKNLDDRVRLMEILHQKIDEVLEIEIMITLKD